MPQGNSFHINTHSQEWLLPDIIIYSAPGCEELSAKYFYLHLTPI